MWTDWSQIHSLQKKPQLNKCSTEMWQFSQMLSAAYIIGKHQEIYFSELK